MKVARRKRIRGVPREGKAKISEEKMEGGGMKKG